MSDADYEENRRWNFKDNGFCWSHDVLACTDCDFMSRFGVVPCGQPVPPHIMQKWRRVFMNETDVVLMAFRSSVYRLAAHLRARGVSFEKAHELILGYPPRR